jgi:tellurite resistance protein
MLIGTSALAVGLDVATAWGRAGGGESYGGGGGSGGGSSDSDGIFWLIYILFELAVDYPPIGVPLIIAIVIFCIYAARQGQSGYVSRTIRRAEALQASTERERALAAIKARDPQFDEQQFLARVSQAFLKIQEAWSKQDLSAVRPFISDGIRERFSFQFNMQQALGYRNQLDNVIVRGTQTAVIISDPQFDTIHVEFRAAADDYRVDVKTGQRVGSPSVSAEFIEYWSFNRRLGAKTLVRAGCIEGHCPHCGAPIEIVDRVQCTSCRSIVNSGEYDWVLSEITQAREWRVPDDEARVPGLAELKAADPAFCTQHIEDRVSVMYWRLRAAEFCGDVAQVAPVSSVEFRTLFASRLAAESPRRFSQDPAVGKVELVEAVRDEANGFDRLQVVVRWSGIVCEGDPRGSFREVYAKAIRTQAFSLIRRLEVKSRSAAAFSSASCSQCGAPIAVSNESACPFCGTTLNDGRYDWVLDSVGAWSSQSATRQAVDSRREPVLPSPSRRLGPTARQTHAELSLAVLAKIAASDGQLDDSERQALVALGVQRGLSSKNVEAVVNTASKGDVDLVVPTDPRQAAEYLRQMVEMSLADGNISSQEKKLLLLFARRMNLSDADVQLEIARQRKERFQAAKGLLRQTKRGTA